MDAREQVRRRVEALGREHVGTSWWVDLAGALVDEFAPVAEERDRLRDAIQKFLDHEDTHVPGSWVDLFVHREIQPVQICDDEDCQSYWPCATARLSAALDRT